MEEKESAKSSKDLREMIHDIEKNALKEKVLIAQELAKLNGKMDVILSDCPTCKNSMKELSLLVAQTDARSRSAHHRIDGMIKMVTIISALIGLFINAVSFIWKYSN